MYYKLKIYVKRKVFSKFRFNVDKQYLDYILKSLLDQHDFIKIGNTIINKNTIKYIKSIAVIDKRTKKKL